MIKKRVIPLMLSRGNTLVKGKNFNSHRVVGNMNSMLKIWSDQEVDELMILNIDQTVDSNVPFLQKVSEASSSVNFPLSVGGGIRTREYARQLLQSGADKVVICSNALRVPSFVHELASEFGSQAIVVIIDYRRNGGDTFVYSNRGKTLEKIGIFEVIEEMQSQGAGEIVLQNIDLEGSKHGLDIKVIAEVQDSIEIPLIISGGAGNFEHLRSALEIPIVSGVACGSLFYFGDNSPIRARAYLRNHGIPMRKSK